MSIIATREVWEADLPSTEKFVLLNIADFSNHKTGTAWPAQRTIARKTGLSRQTVNRAIKRLYDKGVLACSRRSAEGKSTSNVYRINIVALRDIQTNNVAQNDNQMSNPATNQCNGELHKPLPTLNKPLRSVTSADEWNSGQPVLQASNDNTESSSGPPKTPEQFWSLSRERRHLYARTSHNSMRDIIAKGLEYDIHEDTA